MAESEHGATGARNDTQAMLGTAYPAFKKLQDWGCGEDLGALVWFIHWGSVPSIRGDGHELNLHRADSHGSLLNGHSLREARAHIKRARAGLDSFKKALGSVEGRIWQHANINHFYKTEALQFLYACLDELSDALDRTGPKAHPSITSAIKRMVVFVREQTGQYHDSEVAEVIAAAIGDPVPAGYPRFGDAEALKAWRMNHGLYDPQDSKTKVSES